MNPFKSKLDLSCYHVSIRFSNSIFSISQCSIFINCGIQVNAEPLADLLQFQDAFKKRRSLQNSSSRSIIPENYLTHPKTKRECSFEEIRAIHYWLTVEAQLAEKRKIEEAHVAEGQRKEEENIREFDVPDKLLLTESKIKNRLENIENYSLRARESPLDFSRPFVDPSSGDLPIIKPHPVINPSIPHVVDISTRLPYLSSTTKEYSFIDDEPMPFTLASQNIIEDDEEIEANRIKSEAVEDIMSIAGPREPFCDNTLENIESSVCNINVETVKSDIQNFGSVENQISEPVQSLSSGPMGTMEIERLDKVTFEILGNCIDQDEVSFNIHELRKEEYTIEKAFSVHSPFHSFPLIPKKYDSLSLLISLNDDRILEEIAVIYFSRFLLQHFMENMDYKLHSLSLENFEICMSDEDGLEENLLDLTTPKSLVSYLEKIFYLRFHPSSENGTDKWLKTPETFSSLDKYNLDKSQIIQFFHALLFSSTSSSATLASDHSAALINDFNNLEYYSSYWMVLFQILDSSCSHFNNTSSSLILQTHSLNLLLNISENLIYSQRKSFPSLLLLLKKYEVLLYEK